MRDSLTEYRPPDSREELLRRYADGERRFPDSELSGADLSGVILDGACFEKFSWFFDTNFDGASLRGVSFRECNVKCATFRGADLTGASFELAAVEGVDLDGAIVDGLCFAGATSYGYTYQASDGFPNP
jgi:uncharacterized protein YjbI with pentapeptide repeats